jgi:hypothetical protein
MAAATNPHAPRDYRDNYEFMQSDRELQDERDEERYRAADVNFGLDSEICEIEAYAEPARCECGLWTRRVPEPPAAIPAQRETRVRLRIAEVA